MISAFAKGEPPNISSLLLEPLEAMSSATETLHHPHESSTSSSLPPPSSLPSLSLRALLRGPLDDDRFLPFLLSLALSLLPLPPKLQLPLLLLSLELFLRSLELLVLDDSLLFFFGLVFFFFFLAPSERDESLSSPAESSEPLSLPLSNDASEDT